MSFLDDLAAGIHGATFHAPASWKESASDGRSATFVDETRGVGWTVLHFDQALALRSDEEAVLRGDVERHARELFERCFALVPAGTSPMAPKKPRTHDPAWSPVIEVSMTEMGGAPTLRVLHRLWYQPGRDTVMGHFLVPLREGLLELRANATDDMTGGRESTLLMIALQTNKGTPPDQLMRELSRQYDDPVHDAKFPSHCLSRLRGAMKDLALSGSLEVLEPAEPPATTECQVGAFTFERPPRHEPIEWLASPERIQCSRLTFAGTDGAELLTVARIAPTGRSILESATTAAKDLPPGTKSLAATCEPLPLRAGRAHIRAYRSFETESNGVQHTAMRWFVDAQGSWVLVALGTTTCVPEAELFERAEGVVASYRLL